MKHLTTIVFAVLLFGTQAFSQSKADSIAVQQEQIKIEMLNRIRQHVAQAYKLYPTENMWTFLELETFSGKIWQVQYSVKGSDYRFKALLNGTVLVSQYDNEGQYAGRFELYKTQNMYNFILLDTSNGNTWQVQWSTEPESRMIMRIY